MWELACRVAASLR